MPHKTKHLKYKPRYNNPIIEADIDIKLAPVILDMWKLGITTAYCCQGNPIPKRKIDVHVPVTLEMRIEQLSSDSINFAYISFPTAEDAQLFLNYIITVYSENPNSLYLKAVNAPYIDDNDNVKWQYDMHANDHGSFVDDDEPYIEFQIAIRFPQRDIKLIQKKLRQVIKDQDETP